MSIVFRLLGHLPLSALHVLGCCFGWLAWLFSPTYRRHLRENMQLALGASEAARLRGAAIGEAGKQMLELPRIWLRPLAETAARVVSVSGWELVEAATRRGKGILYLTPHLGCFEVTAQYLSTRAPITVLYRQPKQAWLQAMVEAGRAREQLHLASADVAGVRTLLKALRRGEAVGMLPDQAPRAGEGRWLDFFGKPAYTMTLAARLADSGAAVIMVWAERLPGGAGYHFRLQEPRRPIRGTLEERAQQINHEIEDLIRQCPQQYLWGYNRYKQRRSSQPPGALAEKDDG
ncbi:MAG TPA: lysophospholipid acyltransferase family protein [Accumulibacter sp.]|uniref:lysophospholipid acyltransferase family protein n=1 Tax=Accumulibacter sp. TaxID=2053492 RepID=UPI002C902EB7|nr:lysophospholipid acyltransferase family protein [Accumulibacter sp.]HMV06880.1 lysophospholipid acyltransferase family protein [Accumulibacter sp.]HNE39028.1 lysophospholipid acyltransferase family protein [Accumulibacter sp.]HNG15236.1 lysophospholipid acyltransferase family protein [Accumulibacter sp.]